ncbi:MAG TPA: LysE family translocator [Cellvibrio sp.]|nr:LysE family translocator [Cellvibrio sp.]
MTLTSSLSLFIAMLILAVIPGPGIFAVVARAISSGFKSALVTVVGIVCGDYVFILLSLYGLAALAQSMGDLFLVVKYAGAAYLCWLGWQMLKAKPVEAEIKTVSPLSAVGNFMTGFLTTLSNPKAILFYVSFFPAFIDMQAVALIDAGMIMAIATIAVGGVMAAYAYTASKARQLFSNVAAARALNITAGGIMLGSGTLLAIKS